MLVKVREFSRKFSHLSAKMANVSRTLYEGKNFATRADALFLVLEMRFDFKAHLYAHNLVKKCAINHVLSIKLCPSRFIHLAATKSRNIHARIERKLQSRVL